MDGRRTPRFPSVGCVMLQRTENGDLMTSFLLFHEVNAAHIPNAAVLLAELFPSEALPYLCLPGAAGAGVIHLAAIHSKTLPGTAL